MKKRNSINAKQVNEIRSNPANKRRQDLDYADYVEFFELPSGAFIMIVIPKNKGIVFDSQDDLDDYLLELNVAADGQAVTILGGYAVAGMTLSELTAKAIQYLSKILVLEPSVFTLHKESFKTIDPILNKRVNERGRRDHQDYAIIHAVISYLTGTTVNETGATFSLVYNKNDNTYMPTLKLNGYTFDFVTNVNDAFFEETENFSMQYCYDSQPMESFFGNGA